MDDLAIMGNNHITLQKNINIFANFLETNGIKCNAEKTKIIFTGTNKHPNRKITFKLARTDLSTLDYNQSLRYLGCYFSGANSNQATTKQLISNTTEITNSLAQTKGWNGPIIKQISHWIIPAKTEYALNTTFLNKSNLSKIQKQINKLCKNKFRLERTTPYPLILSPLGLNIISLEDRHDIILVKLLITRLNNPLTQKTTLSEAKSIQLINAIWKCPIHQPQFFKPNNWISTAATIAKKYHIHICPSPCPLEIPDSNLSIGLHILITLDNARKSNLLNIKTIKDILIKDSSSKLEWF